MGEEFLGVLDVSELLEWPPVLVVVVFENKGILVLTLLCKKLSTSRTKLCTLALYFSTAFYLKPKWRRSYFSALERIWRIFVLKPAAFRSCGPPSYIDAGCT